MSATTLPGLSRLWEVMRKHDLPIETLPPGSASPRAGELLFGMPVDPELSSAYSQAGKLVLRADTWLMIRCDNERNGFFLANQEWQGQFPHDSWPEHFRSIIIFGNEMLYRYATVPGLVSSEGLQPVIHLDPYEEIHALPVASSVDHFFGTYSRYLEVIADDPDYRAGGAPQVNFPWHVPEIIAKDRPLVEMIRMGRFDPWLYESNKTGWRDEPAITTRRAWIDEVLRRATV
jgi:hypothetical protein